MKAKISSVLLTLAVGAAMPMMSSADTFNLALGIFGGASVTNTSIEFGTNNNGLSAPYAPPGSYGMFEVNLVNAGPFQANGVTVGELGMIQSISAGTFPPATPFIKFNTGGSNLQLFATSIGAGSAGGGSCQVSPGGVFLLCDQTLNGQHSAVASVLINGDITGDHTTPGLETFSGTFSATFNGLTVADLLSEVARGPINSPFSATFSATVIPEPVTLFLMGLGLVGAGLIVRRNKVRA